MFKNYSAAIYSYRLRLLSESAGACLGRGLAVLLLCITACGGVCRTAEAQVPAPSVDVPAHLQVMDLSAQLQLLEDPDAKLGIADVASTERSNAFLSGDAKKNNIGFSTSAWWVRIVLRNDADEARSVLLRQNYPLIDYIDLYEPQSEGRWKAHQTGDRRDFATRDVLHRDLLFPLAIPAHQQQVYYLRYQSQGPVDINLSLLGAAELIGQISGEQMAYGIYFGCVMMLLLWSLLVFVATRDQAFLAYFSYVVVFGAYMSVNNGIAFQFLWPNSPNWGNVSVVVLLGLSIVTSLQFARVILHGRDFAPRLDRFAQVLQVLALAIVAATPFLPYALLIQPIALLTLVLSVFMIVFGIVCLLAGSRTAKVFLMAWGAYMLCSFAYLLKNFGVLPHTFWTQNSWQAGALLEMILLSLTLSSRVRELQTQTRIDALTQLGNRRQFDAYLPLALAKAQRKKQALALLVLDIDHFKKFNDQFGHAAGDDAIRAVAAVLRTCVRKPEIACRYGGEEFVLILPDMDTDAAIVLAERMRQRVLESTQSTHPVRVSVGVANAMEMNYPNAESLFNAADFALYSAKEQGRDRVVAYRDCQPRRKEDGILAT